VGWVLSHLGVNVASLVDRQVGRGYKQQHHSKGSQEGGNVVASMTDDGLFVPDWVLDVREVESSQVKSGQLPEKISLEGVMLQVSMT
jgi:hypothetical protein